MAYVFLIYNPNNSTASRYTQKKVEILDKDGIFVPKADNLIIFEVDGATTIGVENGNMKDLQLPKATERKAFNRLSFAIIEAENSVSLTEKRFSEGLERATIILKAEEKRART